MNEENNAPQVPNFENEPMRMPENMDSIPDQKETPTITNGLILGLLVVLLLLIFGGMYYWFTTLQNNLKPIANDQALQPTLEESNEPENTSAEFQTADPEITSTPEENSTTEVATTSTSSDSSQTEPETAEAELNVSTQ